jgi:hypothetical protein
MKGFRKQSIKYDFNSITKHRIINGEMSRLLYQRSVHLLTHEGCTPVVSYDRKILFKNLIFFPSCVFPIPYAVYRKSLSQYRIIDLQL